MVPPCHLVEVEADVDLIGAQHGAGCAAGNDGLELLAALDAAGNLVDRLAQVVAHGQLVDAGRSTWPEMPKSRVPPLRSEPSLA
jgi:hypothetical protein